MQEITEATRIMKGMPLSSNFILDHMTTGAYHYALGKWIPQFTSILTPGVSTTPTWQIARNLQVGADSFLENLMSEFGGDLILRSAFLSGSNLGNTFGVQVNGFQNNMFNIAKDIQKIARKATSLQVVYGETSFVNVNYDVKSVLANTLSTELPSIVSKDLLTGAQENGLVALRGYI